MDKIKYDENYEGLRKLAKDQNFPIITATQKQFTEYIFIEFSKEEYEFYNKNKEN